MDVMPAVAAAEAAPGDGPGEGPEPAVHADLGGWISGPMLPAEQVPTPAEDLLRRFGGRWQIAAILARDNHPGDPS